MKTLISVYIGNSLDYGFEPFFNGQSAFARVLLWIKSLVSSEYCDNIDKVVIFTDEKHKDRVYSSLESVDFGEDYVSDEKACKVVVKSGDFTSVSSYISALNEIKADSDTIIHCRYSCPFYDKELTRELYEFHKKYFAEYTFAEGWPEGFVPVILNADTLYILKTMTEKEDYGKVGRDVFFDVIKKDINSFEVETLIAPEDMRQYRFDFACETKSKTLGCCSLFKLLQEQKHEECSANYMASVAVFASSVLRTVPGYYNIQLSSVCPGTCTYCPYPKAYSTKFNHSPSVADKENPLCFMSLEQFQKLVKNIADFSGEAVVCLSLWGEALAHPDIVACIKTVLEYPGLSVLIETDGSLVTEDFVNCIEIPDIERTNAYPPLMWIVSLDSNNQNMYEKIRGKGQSFWEISYEKASRAYDILSKRFSESTYLQFVRMKENEEQLESFYRSRKDHVIIQKYDSFAGYMPDFQVTDLSPVVRNPCWHYRRDMVILADGSVPFCREHLLDGTVGNVFSQSLEEVWEKGRAMAFTEKCEKCDEYYTFNF